MSEIKKDAQSTEERYLRGDLEKFVMDNVESCKMFNGNVDWAQLVYLTEQEFGDEFTKEKLRGIYRKHTEEDFTKKRMISDQKSKDRKKGKITLRDQIIKRIKNKCSTNYLFDTISNENSEILAEITRMELEGYVIDKWSENGQTFVKVNKNPHEQPNNTINLQIKNTVSLAIVSDTHFGHEETRVKEFKSFIQYAYDKGVRNVLHVGDVTEGNYQSIRPTSIKELSAIGFDDQFDLANESIPKLEGLQYYMISGNHDHSHIRNTFADPVKMLSRMRDDIIYLGKNFGRITINEKNDIVLVHPTDGIGQNYGLKLHQYIDRAEPDKKGRIILMGHYHKHSHIHYNGIDGFILPAFVGQSNFMKDRNLKSVVGGMILHISLSSQGDIISVIPEYLWFN